MIEQLVLAYLALLATAMAAGIFRFQYLDTAMRLVVLIAAVAFCTELLSSIAIWTKMLKMKNTIYHVSTVVYIILTTSFFIGINRTSSARATIMINAVLWVLLGTFNTVFLQPLNTLNTNMLMLGCFSIVSLSLYTIYGLLKNDRVHNIFLNPYFWMSVLWLIEWSSTFFFWAFIKILYRSHWAYANLVLDLNVIVNMIVYAGIATVLFLYPEKLKAVENS